MSCVNFSVSTDNSCGDYFHLDSWLYYSLFASVPIAILFCFLERRVNLWPSVLDGRPGVAFPVNLVDSYTDRFSYAFAFAGVLTTLFEVISNISGNVTTVTTTTTTTTTNIPVMLQGTVSFLLLVAKALLVSFSFCPTLLCLNTNHKLLGNAVGLCYSLIWTVYYFARIVGCAGGDVAIIERWAGKWLSAPGFVFCLLLTIRFLIGLCLSLYRAGWKMSKQFCAGGDESGLHPEFTKTHFYKRTKFLLKRPQPKDFGGNIVSRLFHKHFGPVEGFRYSRQNICVLLASAFLTYLSAAIYFNLYHLLLVCYEKFALLIPGIQSSAIQSIFETLKGAFWAASVIAIVFSFLSIVESQVRYKKHTLQLWRGDGSFCSAVNLRIEAMMVASLRCMGYRVVLPVTGFVIMQLLLWAFFFFLKFAFVFLLEKYWLTLALILVLYFTQIFLSRLLFLQKDEDHARSGSLCSKKSYLALDNRRVFHVVLYFTMFLNIFFGALISVSRLFKSLLIGTIFMGRADRCTMPRGWERFDPAFRAYIGFLHLEVAHTHPVLITFCHFLNEDIYLRKLATTKPCGEENLYSVEEDFSQTTLSSLSVLTPGGEIAPPARKMTPRVRNRWFLALTLSRNPSLIPCRRAVSMSEVAMMKIEEESRRPRNEDITVSPERERPNSLSHLVLKVDLPEPSHHQQI